MTTRHVVVDVEGLEELVAVLRADGYRVIGPTVRDGAIVLAELRSATQLPFGWGVESGPGRYRLSRRGDGAAFAHSAGPQSWKAFLHPSRRKLWSVRADGGYAAAEDDEPAYAFLGVRGCDLAAIDVLAGPLAAGAHPDGSFSRCRRRLFVVGVDCTEPGGVCFCASMGTGPGVGSGYDLALTEQVDEAGHRFVVAVGTERGGQVVDRLAHRQPVGSELAAAAADVEAAAGRMGRAMPEVDLPALLRETRESPHWEDVADRCLTCANCTMVCPTCFCTTTEDVTDLTGAHAERRQRWASCFEPDFSYLHGGSVRSSAASRYRQWLTHKLGTWHDQFGTTGCVGCGRCIAWCPVGIDLTVEVARLAGRHASHGGDDDADV